MSNINLLPDDLKKKEEKELQRLSRRPKINSVEWNNPSSNGKVNLYSDVPKESFWASIFGTKDKISVPSHLSGVNMQPEVATVINKQPKPKVQENYSDIPKIPKNINKEKFSFSDLFGPASSPIKISFNKSDYSNKQKLPTARQIPNLPKMTTGKKLSFWQKLFSPKEEKHINWVGSEDFLLPKSDNYSKKEYHADLSKMKHMPIDDNNGKKHVRWSNSVDFSKLEKTSSEKTNPNKKNEGDGWLAALKSLFIPNHKKASWKMAGDDNSSRHRLIRESVDLSKDKSWENYSSSRHSTHQKNHFVKTGEVKKVESHVVTANSKHKEKKSDISKLQGKYHLAPKKEGLGININLIPEELLSMRKPSVVRQAVSFLIIIILSSLVVGGLYYFIDFNQKKVDQQIMAEKSKLEQLNLELVKYQQEQTVNYNTIKKILVIDNILKNHVYWTKFFALLEKYTLDTTYYSGFSASVAGKFSLAVTAKDYASALAQIAALNSAKDFAKEVGVDSIHVVSNDKKGAYAVGFDLRINLSEGVFRK